MEFFESHTLNLIVLPLLIFFSRICDVTLGTLRIIFVSKGLKVIAPIIGFFEVLIWLVVISQVMQNISQWWNYLAYAGGFATGNFVGMWIESRMAMGISLVRIITRTNAEGLISTLRFAGYRVTNVSAMNNDGKVEVIFLPVRRKEIPAVIDVVKEYNPRALYTIEEVLSLSEGALPHRRYSHFPIQFPRRRKGK